ncbi:hypothetical protein SPI_06670 [Niveomyces insectorum RCEF 264]|uniref:Uncharacterized protein n=1 Tax=Niveomyces insectorum RCEF 264 TaxID=1081102 RepID=A0A167RHF0_9HYPO|nr:hypothetical protein SPI_06670 [Niveomyces insectorum RCEF 264]
MRSANVTGWSNDDILTLVGSWFNRRVHWIDVKGMACAVLLDFTGREGAMFIDNAFTGLDNGKFVFEDVHIWPPYGEPDYYYIG